ncbi:MAG: hypothetical protein ABFD46_09190 [Armatimonadota bacterium]
MKKREVAAIVFAALGLYLIVLGILTIPGLLTYILMTRSISISEPPVSNSLIIALFSIALAMEVGFGLLLIAKAGKIGNAMFGEDTAWPSANAESLMAAGFLLAGLVFLAIAIPGLVAMIIHIAFPMRYAGEPGSIFRSVTLSGTGNIISTAIQLILGLALILYPNRLASYLDTRLKRGTEE